MADIWDELEADYGASSSTPAPSVAASQPTLDVWDSLEADYGVAKEEPSLASTFWQGIKDSPSTLLNAAKSAPGAAWDLVRLPSELGSAANDAIKLGLNSVIGSNYFQPNGTDYAFIDKTLRGVGKTAAGIAGAGAGALVGGPAGAVIGGSAGMKGFDWLNQLTGSDAPTTPQEDARDLAYNAGQGVGAGALTKGAGLAFKGAGATAGKVTATLDEIKQSMREKAMGVQYGERKSSVGKNPVYLDDSGNVVPRSQAVDTSSSLQERFKTLEEDGFFERAPDDPGAAFAMLSAENAATQKAIGSLIKEADTALGDTTIAPKWERATKYVEGLRKSEQELLAPKLEKIIEDYEANPETGLQKIITLKNQLSRDAKFAAKSAPKEAELFQAAYHDLQFLGEQVFDTVLPTKKGQFRQTNQLAAAQATALETLPKAIAKGRPGILESIFTREGSGPYLGAAGVGSYFLTPQLALPAAGGVWLAKALKRGLTNTKPITMSNAAQTVVDKIRPATNLIEDVGQAVGQGFDRASAPSALGAQIYSEASSPKKETTNKTKDKIDPFPNKNSVVRSEMASSFPQDMFTPSATQAGGDSFFNGATNRNVFDVLPRESMADKSLLKSLAIQESATKGHPEGNPRAIGPETKYGRAKGKYQFLDSTGKEMMQRVGLNPDDYDPFNPDQQEVLANAYIDLLTEQFGSIPLALAAYNYGPGNVSRMLKKYGASSYQEIEKHLPQETRKYVPAILGRLNKDTIEV